MKIDMWIHFRTLVCAAVLFPALPAAGQIGRPGGGTAYFGFDRNEYPGDANLAILHRTFAFTGYWLNPPPGARENTWQGKRARLRKAGFGFLVLFNGRLYAELKQSADAGQLGRADADAAVHAARGEGFPPNTILFLDQEEGGRMLAEQKAYIFAWADGVQVQGFRVGIYCSGMAAREANGERVITAEDLRRNAGGRQIAYWVANDACPPSPGCQAPARGLVPAASGVSFAAVWQYAQSPGRNAGACPRNYAADGYCYAPGLRKEHVFVDLDVATVEDPSGGR